MAEDSEDRSYQKLIANIYGVNIINNWLTLDYTEYNSNIRPDEILSRSQFFIMRFGLYSFSAGSRYIREIGGYFWENQPARDKIYALSLYFNSTYLLSPYTDYKGNGFSLRCVAK